MPVIPFGTISTLLAVDGTLIASKPNWIGKLKSCTIYASKCCNTGDFTKLPAICFGDRDE